MDLQLSGKTALVTGASRGIGLAVVSRLIEEGMRVVAGSRTLTPELAATGANTKQVDLATADGPNLLVQHALEELGELDVLVNNVGGGDSDGNGNLAAGFAAFSDEQWAQMFELNFFSAIRTTRAALPSLLRRRGAIVNISSNGARIPHAGPMPYTTAKAAMTAFSKALTEEVGPQGVRVNAVSPGLVRTALWESPQGYGAELAQSLGAPHEQLLEQLPGSMGVLTGRFVEPAEVAALVGYLASPLAASVTGADHIIDGGSIKTV
ncbi:SDR family NAD(P)-dependent oxidoreductase [Pseudonocardia sp. TRM90224]|uniref:SDR family NAD(P)-dependent oxidoreductase n=1 Tax=Pseudonocardia sp. TRM90224 TaxID=2812678 RepID=UPI001E2B544E|nr:SDR family NAD(P)-dependent oxidoreductase [Pseudonocardia sp. TRM90224]